MTKNYATQSSVVLLSTLSYFACSYYHLLSEVAPELSKCEPGQLKSSALPHLSTVIFISQDSLK